MRSVLFGVGLLVNVAIPVARCQAQRELLFLPSHGVSIDSVAPGRSAAARMFEPRRLDTQAGGVRFAESKGMSPVEKGALIGAAVGFVPGVYGGFRLAEGVGCLETGGPNQPACHAGAWQVFSIVLVTAVGTGAGALVGAGVGEIVRLVR